jgi:excisionase family DNA binding protein
MAAGDEGLSAPAQLRIVKRPEDAHAKDGPHGSVLLEIRLVRPADSLVQNLSATPTAGAEPLLIRVEEAAKLLAISRAALYPMLGREIPVVRIGRAVRIPRQALAEYVARMVEDVARWS